MRRLLTLLLTATIFCPLLTVPFPCSAQDPPRGPWLRLGVARCGSLQPGASRWFSLRCEAGKPHRVESGDPRLEVELYDSARERVVKSARGGLYVSPAPRAERRWVRLVNLSDRRVAYRISWERYHAAPDDHGDDARSATPLQLGDPQPGSIERVGDSDWFGADLEAKREYQFELQGPPNGHLRLELLDSTGERLRDAVLVSGRARRVFLRPLRAGSYRLSVTDQDGNPAVDYTLTWDFVRDDHGDTSSTASDLEEGSAHGAQLDGSAHGALETFEDEDWFVLPLVPGRTHWISYHGVFTIELIDSDGRRVIACGEYGTVRAFTPRTSGPYFLRVPPDMPGRYAISVHVE